MNIMNKQNFIIYAKIFILSELETEYDSFYDISNEWYYSIIWSSSYRTKIEATYLKEEDMHQQRK